MRLKEVYHGGAVDDDLIARRSYRPPNDFCKDLAFENPAPRCRASGYARTLNRVKEIAMSLSIPLHIAIDQENTGRGD